MRGSRLLRTSRLIFTLDLAGAFYLFCPCRQKEPQARPGVARLGPKTAFVGVGERSCLAGKQAILQQRVYSALPFTQGSAARRPAISKLQLSHCGVREVRTTIDDPMSAMTKPTITRGAMWSMPDLSKGRSWPPSRNWRVSAARAEPQRARQKKLERPQAGHDLQQKSGSPRMSTYRPHSGL